MNHLAMIRGDAKFLRVAILDTDGYPVELEELDAIAFTARRSYDGEAVIAKDLDDGITLAQDEAGSIDVAIAADDTSGFTAPARLLWDVQATLGEIVQTVARGYLWVHRDIT